MCLNKVLKTDFPKDLIIKGYKEVDLALDENTVFTLYRKYKLPIGEWKTDQKRKMLRLYSPKSYPTGFHFWARKHNTSASRAKVLGKGILAKGIQNGHVVYVCRKIKVLEVT